LDCGSEQPAATVDPDPERSASRSYRDEWLLSALDAVTGRILWQTADPSGGVDPGAVGGGNGVIFGCSMSGNMYALNGNSGAILWSYGSGQGCSAGASISDGIVYWGTGYSLSGAQYQTPGKLTAFRISFPFHILLPDILNHFIQGVIP
jgi:outer membrane protein assembly factor BamB